MHGEWPSPKLDHENRLRSDNRLINLRNATDEESARNVARKDKGLPRGVYYEPRTGKYYSQIRVGQGRRVVLGTFATADEASEAYKAAVRIYHANFAAL